VTRVSFVLTALLCAAGCGGDKPPAVGNPTKKIGWAEFQKLSPEDQADPYTLQHLDAEAKKKFDDLLKKKGK
jgi:hypothetical protein